MAVTIIRFSEPVNASEVAAETKCKAALEALSDSVPWIVLAGLPSSSSPLHQSDDLDLVPIGPRGVFLIGFGADSGGNSATMAAWRIADPSGILSSPAVGSKMTSFFSASVGIFASRSVIETWSRC